VNAYGWWKSVVMVTAYLIRVTSQKSHSIIDANYDLLLKPFKLRRQFLL